MGDTSDKEEIILARNKINKCKQIDDKEKQIECIYKHLNDVTQAQDIINLTLREIVNDDEDPRWIPIHIVDNANAIILGISDHRGRPKPIVATGGYVEEKMNSLRDKWSMLRSKYGK